MPQESIADTLQEWNGNLLAALVLRILVPTRQEPMQTQHLRKSAGRANRMAVGAAIAGFLTSAALMSLELSMGRILPASSQLQAAFETACAFLWPSAILMLGAQTPRGGVLIFLFSACLNAGYFAVAGAALALAIEKVRALTPVAIAPQGADHGLGERARSPRPAAAKSIAIL